jgi:hypothetical protein
MGQSHDVRLVLSNGTAGLDSAGEEKTMRKSTVVLEVAVALMTAVAAGAAPAGTTGAAAPKAPLTPVHLDLPCAALGGPVGLDVDVKGEQAVLRVEYPRPFESYRGQGEEGLADTSIYFDSDNDVRSGLEEWDAESLRLKGVDYSVEFHDEGAQKVFKHDGSLSMASGSFTSEYLGNVATFTVDLPELHAVRGSVVKALLMVGKCGPVAQTFRLGTASRARTASPGPGVKPSASASAAPTTPVHLELSCPPLSGSVGLDVDVKGEQAVLRVTYPRPFASYRGRGEEFIDTFIYFDSDNDIRSGLEEWDEESLKLKGADYSVAVRELADQGPDAVNGTILHSRVFAHDGTMANATGSFDSKYVGNVATFTVDLPELHAGRGSVVKAMFAVGKCGPVSQTFRLGSAVAGAGRRR